MSGAAVDAYCALAAQYEMGRTVLGVAAKHYTAFALYKRLASA